MCSPLSRKSKWGTASECEAVSDTERADHVAVDFTEGSTAASADMRLGHKPTHGAVLCGSKEEERHSAPPLLFGVHRIPVASIDRCIEVRAVPKPAGAIISVRPLHLDKAFPGDNQSAQAAVARPAETDMRLVSL